MLQQVVMLHYHPLQDIIHRLLCAVHLVWPIWLPPSSLVHFSYKHTVKGKWGAELKDSKKRIERWQKNCMDCICKRLPTQPCFILGWHWVGDFMQMQSMQFFCRLSILFCYLSIQSPPFPFTECLYEYWTREGGVAFLVKPDERHVANGD